MVVKAGPERYLTYRIDVLSTGAIRMANAIYEERCGLGVRELRVLRLVDDQPGITFSELVEQTKLERSLTSRLLNKLIRDGLVQRELAREDARQFKLKTTKAGVKRRKAASVVGEALERHLLKPLSDAQRETLIASLEILTEWVYGDAGRELAANGLDPAGPPGRSGSAGCSATGSTGGKDRSRRSRPARSGNR
jgi:DNA-binding MarR family transcriptional regulator